MIALLMKSVGSTRRVQMATTGVAPRVEQHLLGSIACEPEENFFYLALLSTLGYLNEVTSRLPESIVIWYDRSFGQNRTDKPN
jgi:hypothetical protein